MFPDQIPCPAIQGLNHVAGIDQIDDAAIHERSGFRVAVVHVPNPLELQSADVARIDLVEPAVALSVVIAPHHGPVRWVRVPEHFVRDRDEFTHHIRHSE